ncbi:MAG: diguanylate cyclase [Cyanobacteria bacterium P01_A01_bin.135]
MKLSLRSALIIPLLFQTVGLAVTLTYISLRGSQRAIATVTTQLAAVATQQVLKELEAYIQSVQHVNAHYLGAQKSLPVDQQDLEQLHRQMILEFQQHENLSAVLLGLVTGEVRSVRRVSTGHAAKVSEAATKPEEVQAGIAGSAMDQLMLYQVGADGSLGEVIGAQPIDDVRDQPWYRKAVEMGEPGWGTLRGTPIPNIFGIYAYMPFYSRENRLQGVIATEIGIEQLNRFLRQLSIGKTGEVFIMERSGELIADSTDDVIYGAAQGRTARTHAALTPTREEHPHSLGADTASRSTNTCQPEAQQLAIESASPSIRGAARYLAEHTQGFKAIRLQQQYVAQINGDRRFINVMPYENAMGLDWLVVTIISEADFLGDVHAKIRWVIALASVFLAGAIALCYGLTQWVTKPITTLSRAVRDFEHGTAIGDFPAISQSKTYVQEVSILQQAFHHMARRLSDLLADLETQVQQRTRKLQRSETQLKAAQRVAKMGGWFFSINSGMITWSDELLNIYGLQAAPPSKWDEFAVYLPEGARTVLRYAVQQAIALGQAYEVEHQFTRPDGILLYVISRGEPVFNDRGQVVELICTATDISERKRAELLLQQYAEDLGEWRDRYDAVARASGQVLFEYDLDADVDTWGPNTELVLGYPHDQMPNGMEAFMALIHPEDRPRFQQVLQEDRTSRDPYRVEFRFRRPDGSYVWIREQGITRFDSENRPIQVIGYLADISDYKQAEQRLAQQKELFEQLAILDGLTEVGNRRRLEMAFHDEWQRHQQTSDTIAVAMIDVDHFKAYNDRYGHPAGDACLRRVAQALQASVRPTDLVCRYGGEEFTLLLPKTDTSAAEAIAQRIQQSIAALDIKHPQASPTGLLTVSLGIAVVCPLNVTPDAALALADSALYQAKQTRNAYRLAVE